MPTLTSSRLSVLPVRLTSSATLAQIAERLRTVRPKKSVLEGGWASTDDEKSNLRLYGGTPPESDPRILPAEAKYPERLEARFYFWRKDARVERFLTSSNLSSAYILDAIDIVISSVSPSRFLVLCSTRDTKLLAAGPLKSLSKILSGVDEKAAVTSDPTPLDLEEPDVFLWLANKRQTDPQLDPSTQVLAVHATRDLDSVSRASSLTDGVDFGRSNFLTAVADGSTFGPMRLSVRDLGLNAKLEFELWRDGGFAVHIAGTHYPDIQDSDLTRRAAFNDLAYDLIPRVKTAYNADKEWDAEGRAALLKSVFETLVRRYTPKPQ